MLAPPRAAAQAAPHGSYGSPSPFGALCIWIRGASQKRIVSAVLGSATDTEIRICCQLPSTGSATRAALARSVGKNLGVMKETKDGNVAKEA